MKGTIYLLHFSEAYIMTCMFVGFTTDLSARLDAHANGTGARLMEVITEAGLTFELARTWQGDRKTERAIKNRKDAPRLCPVCDAHAMNRAKATN